MGLYKVGVTRLQFEIETSDTIAFTLLINLIWYIVYICSPYLG